MATRALVVIVTLLSLTLAERAQADEPLVTVSQAPLNEEGGPEGQRMTGSEQSAEQAPRDGDISDAA